MSSTRLQWKQILLLLGILLFLAGVILGTIDFLTGSILSAFVGVMLIVVSRIEELNEKLSPEDQVKYDYLDERSRIAKEFTKTIEQAAGRSGQYRIVVTADYVTAERLEELAFEYPGYEEMYVKHLKSGNIELWRVFYSERLQDNMKRLENIARWMISLRLRIGVEHGDKIRQLVIRGTWAHVFMCFPKNRVSGWKEASDLYIGLTEPRLPKDGHTVTAAVHLTIPYRLLSPSFEDNLMQLMSSPIYEYTKDEEQRLRDQGLIPEPTEPRNVKPGEVGLDAARFLANRINEELKRVPPSAT